MIENNKLIETKVSLDQFKGCILAGAVGDALGAPIEFMSMLEIEHIYAAKGVVDYVEFPNGEGAFTDDTQMLLFTAEGLIRDRLSSGKSDVAEETYASYLRWLITQEYENYIDEPERLESGWLVKEKGLYEHRAPGNTCLTALASKKMGTIFEPLNDSKGCGGVMRVAPVGLLYDDPKEAFQVAARLAAITHGHPSGYLSAGALAAMLSLLKQEKPLWACVEQSMAILTEYDGHEECWAAMDKAIDYSENYPDITPQKIEELGGAWVGEEALAISIYCALTYAKDLPKAIIAAVNHSGDCDSTGSITGNIMGLIHGAAAIPKQWTSKLQLVGVVDKVAEDLFQLYQNEGTSELSYRYFEL